MCVCVVQALGLRAYHGSVGLRASDRTSNLITI